MFHHTQPRAALVEILMSVMYFSYLYHTQPRAALVVILRSVMYFSCFTIPDDEQECRYFDFFLSEICISHTLVNLPTTCNRFRKDNSCCIDRLEQSLEMYTTCYLSYQHGSYALWSQLLMYTQEVDLNHVFESETIEN